MAPRPRLVWAALGFGLAGLAASWNPLAAPFGLAVGVGALVLSLRALRAGGRRALAVSALLLSLAAVAASITVLALTAGVGREVAGPGLVVRPDGAAADAALDAAQEASREARARAGQELETVQPAAPPRPAN
ncbi:MAG: hypothetical protein IPO09_08970 [Anaeromyxobacter sp.]|nr:hypothetical protein [Anaeromyxobacter sp.]MBL0277625.1 hypothetical protein [Anaeromyxobacter sp.]